MPIVRYNPANVTTQPMNAQTSLKTTPEAFTGGLEKTISKVAEVYAQEIDRADDARVLKAKQELSAAANDFLNNHETGVLNARGENAFNSRERYTNEFLPVVDRIKNSLNERQRAKFNPYEFDITQNMNKNIEGHLAKERYSVDEANTKAFLLNEQQSAIYNYTDFGEIERSIERQRNEIKAMAERNGLSTEAAANQFMGAESRTRSIVIEQLVNSNNAQSAKLYLDSNKKKMLPADVLRLEKLVQVGADMQAAQDTADNIISKYFDDPKAAIAEANRRFKDNVKMRDDVKQRIFLHFDEQKKADAALQESNTLYGYDLALANRGVPVEDLIPKDMWAGMDERRRENLRQFARYGHPNQDDTDTYFNLRDMATDPARQQEFVNTDIRSYASKLTKSSMDSLQKLKEDIRSGKKGTAFELKAIQQQNDIINKAADAIGLKYSGKAATKESIKIYNRLREMAESEADKWRIDNKRETIPNSEWRRIVNDLVKDQVVGTTWYGTSKVKPSFDVRPEDIIPRRKLKEYTDYLKKRGLAITEENLWNAYNNDTSEDANQ